MTAPALTGCTMFQFKPGTDPLLNYDAMGFAELVSKRFKKQS